MTSASPSLWQRSGRGERSAAGRSSRIAALSMLRRRPELVLLLAAAATLNLWNLSVNGEANTYYAAAVKTMSGSWSAFFYGTFDPAGLMIVDKPPLALWVQALSVRAFGFGSWQLLVPQALMGVAAVGLVYGAVRRVTGRAGGFVAGLALATTPAAVAIFRHNNPDAALVLCITLALYATVRALQSGRTGWLVVAGVAVGLGFEAKMAAALPIAPAIALAWLWVRPRGLLRSARQLGAFVVSFAVSGLAWPIAVSLVPADDRPWIAGTSDNSVWSLIMGYNGLGRVFGQAGGPGGAAGGPGGMFGGEAGPLRLLNASLGSQGGWLLGAAVGAGVLLLLASRLRRTDPRTGFALVAGGGFAATAITYSYASGIFHPYYVSALAPFTAALVGAGVGTMLSLGPVKGRSAQVADGPSPDAAVAPSGFAQRDAPARLWEDPADLPRPQAAPTALSGPAPERGSADRALRVVGALMLVGGALSEMVVLEDASQLQWLTPVLLVGSALAGSAYALASSRRIRIAAVGAGAALLLAAPAVWAAQTTTHAVGTTFPTGGPANARADGPRGMRGGPGRVGSPPRGAFGPGATGTPPQGAFGPGASGIPPRGALGGPGAAGSSRSSVGGTQAGRAGRGRSGGMFGGDTQSITAALAYAGANGGGTLAVGGQSSASSAILRSDADIAGIGGFSGRETEVSVSWFAQRVAAGDVRWVLTGSDSLRADGRTGSGTVNDAVAAACTAVDSVDGLYDCAGRADELRAVAS